LRAALDLRLDGRVNLQGLDDGDQAVVDGVTAAVGADLLCSPGAGHLRDPAPAAVGARRGGPRRPPGAPPQTQPPSARGGKARARARGAFGWAAPQPRSDCMRASGIRLDLIMFYPQREPGMLRRPPA